jgi:hypothetical protein
MVTFAALPWVKVVGLRASVVVVAVNVTELHRFTRFATFIEPRPVARSYPTVL